MGRGLKIPKWQKGTFFVENVNQSLVVGDAIPVSPLYMCVLINTRPIQESMAIVLNKLKVIRILQAKGLHC